jgi:hypothetical protein
VGTKGKQQVEVWKMPIGENEVAASGSGFVRKVAILSTI